LADWEKVQEEIRKRLEGLKVGELIPNEAGIYDQLSKLMQAITETVISEILKTRPSSYVKRWWSNELAQKHTEVHMLGRRAYERRADPHKPVHKHYKGARNAYGDMIKKVKNMHWETFLQMVDDRSVWNMHHYSSGDPMDGGRAQVPMFMLGQWEVGAAVEVASNEGKRDAFIDAFFPAPAQDKVDNPCIEYPTTKFWRVIAWLSPYKTPGPDGISNSVFTNCADLLDLHLGPIYRATFNIGVYLQTWKDLVTVVIWKPPSLTMPNLGHTGPLHS